MRWEGTEQREKESKISRTDRNEAINNNKYSSVGPKGS